MFDVFKKPKPEVVKKETTKTTMPGQEAGMVKVSSAPSFDDVLIYFREMFRNFFEQEGICYEDLEEDFFKKMEPSGELYQKARNIYESILLKDGISINDEIAKIRFNEGNIDQKNRLLHDLYAKKIFRPIFEEMIKEIPKEDKMSRAEVAEKIEKWKSKVVSYEDNLPTEQSFEEILKVYTDAIKYRRRYTEHEEEFNKVIEDSGKYLGDFIEGMREMNEMTNPDEIRKRTEGICLQIIELSLMPSEKVQEDQKEKERERRKMALVGLLNKYDKKLIELNRKDSDIIGLINEARHVAGLG